MVSLNFVLLDIFYLFKRGISHACHARKSFHHMTSFCMRRKGVSGSAIFYKPATGTIHKNLKFKAVNCAISKWI